MTTREKILQDLRAGVPMRWIPRSISGVLNKSPKRSDLWIGNDLATTAQTIAIHDLEAKGIVKAFVKEKEILTFSIRE